METSAKLLTGSAEAAAAALQTINAFAAELSVASRATAPFSSIGCLAFGFHIRHPLARSDGKWNKASYHQATNVFYSSACLDYAAWVSGEWGPRVGAVAAALDVALGAVHKTRLTTVERARLEALARDCELRVKSRPPEQIIELRPVYLMYEPDRAKPDISFDPPVFTPPGVRRIVVLPASEIAAYLVS